MKGEEKYFSWLLTIFPDLKNISTSPQINLPSVQNPFTETSYKQYLVCKLGHTLIYRLI